MKYELVKENYMTLQNGNKVYQIRALKDFLEIKASDLGGFIESEDNLSQDGDCWVAGGIVFENARVQENARVNGKAELSGNAVLGGYDTLKAEESLR